jgi:NADH:ubiquinone oxidoreductase subunit D
MKLDSEEQRKMLLTIVNQVKFSGTFTEIKQALTSIQQLIQKIENAPLENQIPKTIEERKSEMENVRMPSQETMDRWEKAGIGPKSATNELKKTKSKKK